jgi:RNA polymerase primary sigma factor
VTTTRTRRARSPFDSYLLEIDRTPLLTAAEERELADRIAAGDPAARDRLVRANLRLVVCVARQYVGKGLAMEDLVAEGNMGLMRAAEGFDPTAGTRFATYATYWIRQSIRRSLSRDGNSVRLPQYMATLVGKWHQTAALLVRELGRAPTEEEVAARLALRPKQTRAVRKALRALASGRAGGEAEDGGSVIEELVADRAACPSDAISRAEQLREALDSLDDLSEREATILRMRFGLDGTEPVTLNEVGRRMGYTRERVRQIERDALAKLRARVA